MYFISGEEILISSMWKMNIAQSCMSAVTWWKVKKAMGETLERASKECQNDDIWTQMNNIKKNS